MSRRPPSRRIGLALWLMGAALLLPSATATASPTPSASDPDAPDTVISLTFDDGMRSHARVARILTRHGLPGTFFVNTGALGLPQYLEPGEVRGLQDAGHEVGGHTIDHRDLTALDAEELDRVVCEDRRALALVGVEATSFAYPYGAWSPAAAGAVAECGYRSARISSGLRQPTSCTDCPWTETWPAIDHRYNVRTPGTVRTSATAESLQGAVLRAEAVGGWLPLVFHRVCGPCERPALPIVEFRAFVRWLSARPSSTRVLGVSDAVDEGDARSAAADAAAATPRPPATFSLEGSGDTRGENGTEASRDVVTIGGVDIDQTRVILFAVLVSVASILSYRVSQRGRRHSP